MSVSIGHSGVEKWATELTTHSQRWANLAAVLTNGETTDQPFVKVRDARRTREGRAQLRAQGKVDKNTLDMTSRPFIGWDGEGITYSPGEAQAYVLFGASTGDYVIGESLTTMQCLNLMLKVKMQNPHAIMVGFAIGYDAEMIMRELSPDQLRRVHQHTVVRWRDYRIEYIPKKWFQVTGMYADQKITCRIWDVWSFFTCSFVKALEQYIPEIEQSDLDLIITGKGQRGAFTVARLESDVVPYWQKELVLLVRLMTRLRELLHKAELYPKCGTVRRLSPTSSTSVNGPHVP